MPILIDEAGGIIAGHGRVLAARSLGHKDLPVVIASGWSETKKRAYVIADNKLALNAGWDNEMLSLELQELQDVGFDLDLLGFDPSEMNAASVDYSVLDGEDVKDQLSDMAKGVRKAIQIEFEPEHYDEAFELVKFWRDQKGYVGMMLMNHLKNEKSKL
jgi:ParB-like chromosome segregation protein Spo0J